MEQKQNPELFEFLVEAELQQYYNSLKNELKITAIHQLKYATDQDFRIIGFSSPEIRRIHKFYDKHSSQGYLNKIKRLLLVPKRDESANQMTPVDMKPSVSPYKVPNNKHIIPIDNIIINKQLGVGEFGIVQQGVWANGSERIQVAIKCLCKEKMQSPMEFLKEAAIMHSIDHENIVRLYGVVLSTDSLMLVTELAHLRSLLECLKDSDLRVKFLTVPVLCDFAQQICCGMKYLETNRLIHRDLAARNILVFSKNKVKISDFGLSRALGVGKDYYKTNFNVNLKLPIAWCAPECVNYLKFTSASDVWAFAVCLWEMFSYGFQPWPAFTGHQILEAIDKPNFQRLEQPECCPKEFYTNLMLKCWNHDPLKRPKFSEIYQILPDMKPEQLKTVTELAEANKDHLVYRQGEVITVLDKSVNLAPYWLGVLDSGKVGLFSPANTVLVSCLESLPSSSKSQAPGFFRNTLERSSKRKLNTDMISGPQNDLKHTGHVGIDGAYFGNVAFLSNPQTYSKLPRQVVTPYKPSEDLEQTPLLLPPTPTSPSSQIGSVYFPESSNVTENNHHDLLNKTDSFSADFQRLSSTLSSNSNAAAGNSFNDSNPFNCLRKYPEETQDSHDYHEISDDEALPTYNAFDLGPSLLDEMDLMFRSMSAAGDTLQYNQNATHNFDNVNKHNELAEINSKLARKPAGSSNRDMPISYKSKKNNLKPISVKDEKILNQAIEIANEMSARSMTDLNQNQPVHSPRRKFSFRFPTLTHSTSHDKETSHSSSAGHTSTNHHQSAHYAGRDRRNFTEELASRNVPDLQDSITAENSLAYKSLVDAPKDLMLLPQIPSNESSEAPAAVQNSSKGGTFNQLLRRAVSNDDGSSSPLKILRDKTFPLGKQRRMLPSVGSESVTSTTFLLERDCENPCETPSYMANAMGNFPLCTENVNRQSFDNNPLPLPPRDRNSANLSVTQKRHVRKYPLIIPSAAEPEHANKSNYGSLQREATNRSSQLPNGADQVATVACSFPVDIDDDDDDDVFNNLRETKISDDIEKNVNNSFPKRDESIYKKEFIENNFPPSNGNPLAEQRTYENLEIFQKQLLGVDTASVNFEEILENDDHVANISDDLVDGFCVFESSTRNAVAKKPDNNFTQAATSTVIELKKTTISQKYARFAPKMPRNELASNALFNKIKESVENASSMEECEVELNVDDGYGLKKSLNHVSCEDLLDFSEKKPNGRERGVESDEVRIMIKMFGSSVTTERCLMTLDFTDWDLQRAIKICKLQNLDSSLSLQECLDKLEPQRELNGHE